MVRRPLLYAAISFISSILVFQYFGRVAVITVVIFLLLSCFINVKPGRRADSRIYIVMFFFLLGTFNITIYEGQNDPLVDVVGRGVVLEGSIKSVDVSEDYKGDKYTRFTVKAYSLNNEQIKVRSKILVWDYSKQKFKPEDKVKIIGQVELPDRRRNPKCFDYGLYLESVGIRTVMKQAHTEIIQRGHGLSTLLHDKKEKFCHELLKNTDKETAGIVLGIMFGEKSGINDGTLEEFQKNGTAHILAVSGLHIGIIYGFISLIWLWKKKWMFFISVSLFFFLYIIIADFAPSVIRAVFMVEMHTFSKLINRRYDLATAAFTIALIMLLHNPMQIFHVGFQMSFLAVLSLALLMPYIKKIHKGMLAGGLAIQIGMTPITVFTFNYISIAGIFANVFIIFLGGIIVPLGLVSFFFMGINQAVFSVLGKVLQYLCGLLVDVNHITCIDGVTIFNVVSPSVSIMTFYYLFFLVFLSEEGRTMFIRRQKKKLALCLIIIIIASGAFGAVCKSGFENTDLVFVDVGQGDCIHFKTEDNKNYLIDGGGSIGYQVGKKTLKPYLLKNGIGKIDGAFVTHLHTDHYKGIQELCREGMVERLFIYEGYRVVENKIIKGTGLQREKITYLHSNQVLRPGEDVCIEVLWPQKISMAQNKENTILSEDENVNSLILKVDIKGTTVMVTGDVDGHCQDSLTHLWGNNLKSHILKVSHHGSKYSYSDDFNDIVMPDYAVFQVGKNSFGHPNGKIINNYKKRGAIILRNDLRGAIGFDLDGEIQCTFGLK